ncbi:MAG: 2-amino-4-hydroxy-6-hydroxymethyldihydropteridine diphosphokinase [Pseudomonadota bacterium]|nr:2-amino-4-hydroxy-6-hydroxymethyldihydropteridine diphosphokinase [Pseudomonadota bacterium]
MIYALALGTNIDHAAALQQVHAELMLLGHCQYSSIYELPDRAGRAHLQYWNQAVLLQDVVFDQDDLLVRLNQIEQRCGRVRPSQYVRMDIDLIGAGHSLAQLDVVSTRLPLPADVYLPMLELWPDCPHPVQPLQVD